MKIKQHILDQPKDQGRNHKRLEKNLKISENVNTTYQNLRDAVKEELRGKFIGVNMYIKKERSQINNLTLYLKELEKEQTKPKVSRWNEIIKIRAEINKIDNRNTIGKKNPRN